MVWVVVVGQLVLGATLFVGAVQR
ncbi:MAG: hypothetical protein QOH83_2998, partial [Solirubrobacteraceae bacterium]|nr:hypothetical protein [Solirubrobacteraceae bacterium]